LRKVPTSDFYIEPFLRDEPVASRPRNNPPPKVNTSPKQQPSTLVPKQNNNSTARNNKPAQKPPKPNNDNSKTVTSIPVDSASSTAKVPNLTTNKPPRPAMNSTPAVIRNRSGELMRTLTIHNPKVTVKIFDNGEIDDDTVSVYLNGRLMLSSKKLTAAPIILNFLLDDDNPDQELTMVAENLGRIPPNTSLMIVEAGDQRFDVRITSTEQKNAVVRFRYEPKE
jgi:hypothetical protein